MSFADFLEVMHTHNQVEKVPDEILDAFRAADPNGKGLIPAKELKHILGRWGEKLSSREGSQKQKLKINYFLNWLLLIICEFAQLTKFFGRQMSAPVVPGW